VILAWRRRGAPLLRHTVVLAFGALTATLLVAAIAAAAPHDAWVGAYLRRHGIFTWLALAVVFAAMCSTAGTPTGRDRLLGATVLGSIWPSCYALLQRVGVDPVSWIADSTGRAGSTLGNPIFLGGPPRSCRPRSGGANGSRHRCRAAAALAATVSRGRLSPSWPACWCSAWWLRSQPRGRVRPGRAPVAAGTATAMAAFPARGRRGHLMPDPSAAPGTRVVIRGRAHADGAQRSAP
jgi:hypothetical protein